MFFVLFAISRFLLYNESQVTAAPLLSAANDPCNLRTIWDIVWGSAATIFLCTWIAIHPNIPAPTDPWLVITFRRVRLWIYALLVPEMVIFWAMRQWIAARTISQRYRDRGWTQTHGFFIQMGGFMLYEGDSPVHILSVTEFEDLVQKGEIEFPDISEQEIKDKSKGDMISKGIVVLQTSWFIIQCIARAFQKLAITELELVTLSFCALNGLMYYLWWNKPLDVCCTVRDFCLHYHWVFSSGYNRSCWTG
ncbi:hypothetical protein BDQ12DRAFT_701646 [Crucibulum laeve]|uniref:Uncharacterized protein n=1 Tax=Crucibulum laeve TaxID=68775 RepID=A0A5C3LE98_9AGAR|nr:hypothetical protein BDQ12DRAFT_701646 [Crucibulum laeve]